jgi:hypothetical protein
MTQGITRMTGNTSFGKHESMEGNAMRQKNVLAGWLRAGLLLTAAGFPLLALPPTVSLPKVTPSTPSPRPAPATPSAPRSTPPAESRPAPAPAESRPTPAPTGEPAFACAPGTDVLSAGVVTDALADLLAFAVAFADQYRAA